MVEDKLLTAEEVTKMLGFTNVNTVWRMARNHKIDTVVFGTRRRFRLSVVEEYIRYHTMPATSEIVPDAQETKEEL